MVWLEVSNKFTIEAQLVRTTHSNADSKFSCHPVSSNYKYKFNSIIYERFWEILRKGNVELHNFTAISSAVEGQTTNKTAIGDEIVVRREDIEGFKCHTLSFHRFAVVSFLFV